MDIFILSAVVTIIRQNYLIFRKDCVNPVAEVAESEVELKRDIEDILTRHPYNPAFFSMLDYHGQLQTGVQFVVRNAYLTIFWALTQLKIIPDIIKFERELIILSDNGTVGLDWAYPTKTKNSNFEEKGIVVINHGVFGYARSEYIVFQAKKLLDAGFTVAVMISRGCGGVPLTTSKSFAGDQSNDCQEVITYIKSYKAKDKSLFLLGFSLGAATSLKYLGYAGKTSPLVAAAAVCPPWNMSVHTEPKVFIVWNTILTNLMKLYIIYHYDTVNKNLKHNVELHKLLKVKGVVSLDNLLYDHYGYSSSAEYRDAVSPINVAENVVVPTLSFSSEDDPICSDDAIPHPHSRGCGLVIVKTKIGGHLGFPTRDGIFGSYGCWPEDVVVEWFIAQGKKVKKSIK